MLAPDVEQQLADMTPGEFAALTARLRAPDIAEQFRDVAGTVVPAKVLDTFVRIANPAAFVAADGSLDVPMLLAHLRLLFGPLQREVIA